MANDEHNVHPKRQWQGISSHSVVAVLVAVLVLAVIYAAGMMMWVEPNPDRTTTGAVQQSQPSSTPPTVSPPPLTPSQQAVPQPVTPQPDPQAAPPRSGGG